MNYEQFSNLSCYEEFEIKSALTGISKIDILKEIGDEINDYYFFVSNDGIFNWFDLDGNHVENPGILKVIEEEHIPGNITKCIIPNGVKRIGCDAFSFCESLRKIIIPDSVTVIDSYVFCYCKSLTSITIPDSVEYIGAEAFHGCESLQSITIPDSVKSIEDNAFYSCELLQSITIPNSVTSIGYGVFSNCVSLKEITIPNTVESIGDDVFSHCISLKEVIFKGKTLDEVKRMEYYPFGIKDESIIKVSEI